MSNIERIGVNGAPIYCSVPWNGPIMVVHPGVIYQGAQVDLYTIYPFPPPQIPPFPVVYANAQPVINALPPPQEPSVSPEPVAPDAPIVISRMTDDGSVKRDPKRLFSKKLFIGNIPHWGGKDTEFGKALECIFRRFGKVEVLWPPEPTANHHNPPRHGFIFLVYEKGGSILRLLKHCVAVKGELYMDLGQALDSIYVHIRMWYLDDAVYCPNEGVVLPDSKNAIVLGRVPRTITAAKLAEFMSAYGVILRVEIEVDPVFQYPEGRAIVYFDTHDALRNAVVMRRINMEPLIGRNWMTEVRRFISFGGFCDGCQEKIGTKYCTRKECRLYYCDECWIVRHSSKELKGHWAYQEVAGEVTGIGIELKKKKLQKAEDGELKTTVGTGAVT